MISSKCFVFSLCLAFALPLSVAHAAYTNTMNSRQFSSMYAANADFLMSQMIQQGQWRSMRMTLETKTHKPEAPSAAPAEAEPPAPAEYKLPLTASDFEPTGPRNAPEQMAAGATTPEDRAQLIEAGRVIHQSIEAMPGFRRNNLAAAMTVLLAISLQVQYAAEFSDAESQDLMRRFNDLLGDLPALKKLSAEQRTQMYDAFIVIGGYIAGIAQQGAETGNPELTAQAKAMAHDALAQFGL